MVPILNFEVPVQVKQNTFVSIPLKKGRYPVVPVPRKIGIGTIAQIKKRKEIILTLMMRAYL